MGRKLLLKAIVILFCIAFHGLNTQARVFKPKLGSTVLADSIISAINRGDDIIIRNCKILRPLIKEARIARTDTIKSDIYISRSTFSDRVSFMNYYFTKKVSFYSDSLSKDVRFMGVTFGGDADFWNTTFGGLADFSGTKFDLIAYFRDAAFGGVTRFCGVTFGRDADFTKANFNSIANFRDANFDSIANFEDASFGEFADFRFATFGGDAYFRSSTFGKNTNFDSATFNSIAYFIGTNFDSIAYFIGATFDSIANFWYATFNSIANFSEAAFGGDAYFSFTEFRKEVDLNPKEFKNIYISWDQLKGHLVYDGTANYKLMKYFEEQRKLKDADGIFLFLKDQERMEKHPLIRYPEYWFIQLTCGYGRKPLNTFIFSILIVILFAVFFADSRAIKEIEPTASGKRFYNALYFSVHTFIIGIVSNWHPSDEFLIDRTIRIKLFKFRINKEIKCFKFRTLSMIEGALGWILVIILIISLERTIGR